MEPKIDHVGYVKATFNINIYIYIYIYIWLDCAGM